MPSRDHSVLFCDSLPFWGGGEHWMVTMAGAIRERGWQATIAGRHGAEIINRAISVGVPTVAWPYRRDFDLATIIAAHRYLKFNRPDSVVLTTGRDIRTVGLAARWLRIPVVWRMGLKPKHNWIHRVTGRWVVDHVLAPSEYVRGELEQFPWLRGKTTVIPNGIAPIPPPDIERIRAARMALDLPTDELIILYAGRLLAVKGVDILIRAYAALVPPFPGSRLVLVGDGGDRERFQRLVVDAGIEGHVEFRGYTTDPAAYLDACDLLALASRSETFGFVLLEAMQRGKAIVATRVGAVSEVVTDECALLVPPENHQSLSEAIGALLSDAARRRVLGEAGHRRFMQHFTADRMIESTMQFFEQVIADHQRMR
ncbi:MAG: glycosyltransferase family 4 protein [Candidatus Zixiibacteriota bacterium]